MGEVYKARDTRLDRIVAIKVLPTHLAGRAELRERFEREAKTIASLNHPHICTLFDTGHQDDIDFLVMEYIEGETLAQRLVKGALPIQQVMQYAIEIADALDKAHRKGITHRDLKPGNIMLTKSGTKLLDFGLAKLKQDATPVTPESQLATMRGSITGEGTILGTLQYMAPEQVEGKRSGCPHGHFRVRRGGLRNGDGQESVRRQEPGQPDGQDSGDRSSVDVFAHADDAAGAGPRRQALHGKRSGRALAIGQRYLRAAEVDFRKRLASGNARRRPLRNKNQTSISCGRAQQLPLPLR